MFMARELELDGVELKQKIVSECTHQREPCIEFTLKFTDQRAQDRKSRRLLAALFLGKQRRQRLQLSVEGCALETELLPMRMAFKNAEQNLVQHFAARVQRVEHDVAA